MCRPREVNLEYRSTVDRYNAWEEEERARQDKLIAVARLEMREQSRYCNLVLRWLRGRGLWLKWFSL